jgi:hypothetical protein
LPVIIPGTYVVITPGRRLFVEHVGSHLLMIDINIGIPPSAEYDADENHDSECNPLSFHLSLFAVI